MVNVSWNDAMAFCRWLSRKEGKTYRLPSEAQWEYACRAGTTTRYYNGDNPEMVTKVGNVADATVNAKFPRWGDANKSSDGYVFTAPVGSFHPNAFGLYDMHGNAWEWCADWYDAGYYATSPLDNPAGPRSGVYRVMRGCCWAGSAFGARSAQRNAALPGLRSLRPWLPCCQDCEFQGEIRGHDTQFSVVPPRWPAASYLSPAVDWAIWESPAMQGLVHTSRISDVAAERFPFAHFL